MPQNDHASTAMPAPDRWANNTLSDAVGKADGDGSASSDSDGPSPRRGGLLAPGRAGVVMTELAIITATENWTNGGLTVDSNYAL